jgi:flagellar protein FliO/FliZ
MLALTLRLVASLAVVVGLMLLLARIAGRRVRGAGRGSVVRVLHRQPLSRGSAVTVVTIGGRVLVLGSTEQQVSLLTELDPFELEQAHDDVPERETVDGLGRLLAPGTTARATAAVVELTPRDGTDVVPPAPARGGSHRAARPSTRPAPHGSALGGSILAPDTWRQAIAAVTGRAS